MLLACLRATAHLRPGSARLQTLVVLHLGVPSGQRGCAFSNRAADACSSLVLRLTSLYCVYSRSFPCACLQDGLRIDISAWDAQNRQLGLAAYQLSFFRPTVIDLRTDLRFSGIYR